MAMLIIGSHMSIAGGFAQAAKKTGEEYGCNAMQIFTKSPRSVWRDCAASKDLGLVGPKSEAQRAYKTRSRNTKPIDPNDAEDFKDHCDHYGIKYVIAHSSYLLNLAKPFSAVPWALKDLETDYERLEMLGGNGVIVHIGKSLDNDPKESIKNVIENAKKVVDETQETGMEYILENTAGQGTEIGHNFEELSLVWKGLKGFSPRIKSCLDTAHVWGAGYDISSAKSVKKVLKEYDELVGLNTLSCIHFNNAKKECGCKVDRHENIEKGAIGLEGLMEIANYAKQNSVPLILETPQKDGMTHLGDIQIVRAELEK